MVNFSDLKFYDSTGGLGGPIVTSSPIQTATPNNMFVNFTRSQVVAGSTKYKCFYMKNESSEDMENFRIWISTGTPLDYTGINFGFDALANPFDGVVGFDGVNDYIDCGDDTDLWSKPLTKFSFSLDIFPQTVAPGTDRYVLSHGGAANNGFRVIIDGSNPTRLFFRLTDGGVPYDVSTVDLELNAWNHVACSYDGSLGSDNLKIFLNGELKDTETYPGGNLDLPSTVLTLADSSTDFDGYMSDFKFWDDQAINTDEAIELYEEGEITNQPPAYHLNFGEGTGATTTDRVSKTKTATLSGASWKTSAASIPDTFTEPDVHNGVWYAAGDTSTGKTVLAPNQTFPIWVKVTVDPDSTATPYLDDFGIFTIRFDITSTGTSSGGSGGSGGGTGGSTGGGGTSNFKIAVAGDWGNTGDTTDVVNLLKEQNYDLILGVGDNAYDDSSASSWCNKFKVFQSKMESAWGNHEYEEDGGTTPYKNFFGYTKSYHSHRFQNCLILILDSNDDKSGVDLDAQRTWAKNELEKYKNDTKVVWRIAVMHHPWFGTGGKHEENEFDQVQKFHKLFTDYDVNFVYTGHNHNWHRSHQVAFRSGNPTDPNIVDSSSPYSRKGNGLIQINSGAGGHDGPGDLYSLPDDDSFWAYRNKNNNGVHELVASNGGNTLTGRFRNVDGNTSDTFVINA